MQESVIRWTGNKRRLAPQIISLFPDFSGRYFEPFLGGGGILYGMNSKKAICSDICKPLVEFWIMLRDNPEKLAASYRKSWKLLQEKGHTVYYDIRARFNRRQNPQDLLFLTRTCVNGLIRFNLQGEFNNAFHLTRPGINPDTLERIIMDWSGRLQKAEFFVMDYTRTFELTTANDFAYLDPPYFHSHGLYYGNIDHDKFFAELEKLNLKNVKWLLSYDGGRGEKDFTVDFPPELYKKKFCLNSGLSPMCNVIAKKRKQVTESLYANF